MASDCIQTFIQISDLHFGDLSPTGQLVHPRGIRTLWTVLPFVTGLAGHEAKALVALGRFYKWMRGREPNTGLFVTGDLTSTGRKAQFEQAISFIGSTMRPPSPRGLGLETGAWLKEAMGGKRSASHQAIPGNHDHWPGRFCWVLGRCRAHMPQWARHFPLLQTTLSLRRTAKLYKHPVRLRFLAVNTDADVWAWGPERVLARGSFHTQLRRLKGGLAALGPTDPYEVRIMLLHHSLAYRSKSRLGTLEINEVSRRRLLQLLGEFDIRVILTGHTHTVDVRRHYVLSPERRRPMPFLEACCGTTTQLNDVPSKWPRFPSERVEFFPDRKLASNFLLVHRLFAEPRGIVWKTESWQRGRENGFVRAEGNEAGEPWASELLVWSRA
jgi:3',5'-cyclic AMP phosphodiesterase CpdA